MAGILSQMFNKQQDNQPQMQQMMQEQGNNVLQQIRQNGLSDNLARVLYQNNPYFKQFVDQAPNKDPMSIFNQMGTTPDQIINKVNNSL